MVFIFFKKCTPAFFPSSSPSTDSVVYMQPLQRMISFPFTKKRTVYSKLNPDSALRPGWAVNNGLRHIE